jgi:hypothetical protein
MNLNFQREDLRVFFLAARKGGFAAALTQVPG